MLVTLLEIKVKINFFFYVIKMTENCCKSSVTVHFMVIYLHIAAAEFTVHYMLTITYIR